MQKNFLLFFQLGILGILIVWHNILGINYGMYNISWWDIVAHILGGMWVALGYSWISIYLGYRISLTRIVVAVFAVGVAWEIFEYVAGIYYQPFMPYAYDTAKDLVDDVIGALIAGYLVTAKSGKLRFM